MKCLKLILRIKIFVQAKYKYVGGQSDSQVVNLAIYIAHILQESLKYII